MNQFLNVNLKPLQIQKARRSFRPDGIPETEDLPEDREPNLDGFTSEWDLQGQML